jgi:hypothetical protein
MTDHEPASIPDDQFGFRDPWGSNRRLAAFLRAKGVPEQEVTRLITFRTNAGMNIRIHKILGTLQTEIAKGGPTT